MDHPSKNLVWLAFRTDKCNLLVVDGEDIHKWTEYIESNYSYKGKINFLTLSEYGAEYNLSKIKLLKSWFIHRYGEPSEYNKEWLNSESGIYLRYFPQLWWKMHSASQSQLEEMSKKEDNDKYIIGSYHRQIMEKNSHKGPSFVKHRWIKYYPDLISYLDKQNSISKNLGIRLTEKELISNWENKTNLNIIELGSLYEC